MRNWALQTIDSMILGAVKPAWAGMRKAVEELRVKLEPKIRELTEPIFKAENEIIGKMRGNNFMSRVESLFTIQYRERDECFGAFVKGTRYSTPWKSCRDYQISCTYIMFNVACPNSDSADA